MELLKKAFQAGLLASIVGSTAFAQNLNDAKKAIDAEQYQQAKSTLKKLIAAQPNVAENYFYLGNVYLKNDYIDSAKAVFTQGTSANAQGALNYVGLGAVELANNNASAAKVNFDKAISLTSKKDNDPYIFAAKALIAADKPDYETAIAYLEKAKAIDQKDAEVYLALGDAYRGQKRNSDAYSAYRAATDLDKNLLRANIELGVLNKRSKAFNESIEVFKAIIAANPNYGPAYRELAETNLNWSFGAPEAEKNARLQEAIANYKKYLDLTDKSVDSRVRYSDFLVYAGDWKALEQEAQEMLKQDQTNPRIYRYLGVSAFENGNYQTSVDALNNFISKVEPRRVISLDYLYLGKAQMKVSNPDYASNFAKAVEKDSSIAGQFSTIAYDVLKEKKYGDAAKLYELALKAPASPSTVTNYFYLGYANYYDYVSKKPEERAAARESLVKADSAFSKVNTITPDYAPGYLYRARVNKFLDNDKNPKGLAVPYYEKYIELLAVKPENLTDPKNKRDLADAYNNIGASYLQSNPVKAKEYFNKTLSLDPGNSYASDVIKQLNGSK
jgi:tetratricopeptide (TPR) repeat protein